MNMFAMLVNIVHINKLVYVLLNRSRAQSTVERKGDVI